ncbi:MAG: TonB-dependent receptor [Candidatus Marinimicrobia bacterium]|nr:TonB-dependent receptor [Candidatus Neomarinimicrobiota bacterium]
MLSLVVLAAQTGFSLRGAVTDAATGEDLIGAAVSVKDMSAGTFTNSYGFYSMTLPRGKHEIRFSFIGYDPVLITLDLQENTRLDMELTPSVIALQGVTVSAERPDEALSSTRMSVAKLDIKDISVMPVLFGEADILKTLQLLPGISSASEGSTGFNVRGGANDENLILLDEATVYSPSHLLGFVSVFNSDVLNDVMVYKGGIPAYYGGRTSSVIDVQMNNGNNKEFAFKAGIGLISSRLTIEGPIIKDKMSFIISGRRSYADLILKALNLEQVPDNTQLYFYDFNAKINYKINDNNRIFLSGYFGDDVFGFKDVLGTSWGNRTGTVRWNHLFSDKLFSNLSLIHSNYGYGFKLGEDAYMSSGIVSYSLKEDLTFYPNLNNTVRTGVQINAFEFEPGELVTGADSSSFRILLDKKYALETALYLSNEHSFSPLLSAEYGVRTSLFTQLGPGTAFRYDEDNNVIDSTVYDVHEIMQYYGNLEPRLSLNYRLTDKISLKASYNRMAQNLHLLSNSTSGQVTDVWLPSSTLIKPLVVDQVALGYFHNFDNNTIEASVEAYYKHIGNVADFEDGTNIMLNENIEAQILIGEGRSYGLELYVKKKFGDVTGWISYTFSRTELKIDGINLGEWYPAKYDRSHDISLIVKYQFNERLYLSGTWVFYTGNAVTFPSGQYTIDGEVVPYYTERNGYRMPDYHRLDLNLHIKGKESRRFVSSWDISVYNTYNRYNAYSIYFRESEANPDIPEAVQVTLFGIVPSITYNIEF